VLLTMHSRTRTTLDWLAELDLGAWILGIGSFIFGFACLLQRDFAIYWQPVPAGVPFREALAFASAVLNMVSGLALLDRRTARLAAQVNIALYLIFAAVNFTSQLWRLGVAEHLAVAVVANGVREVLHEVPAADDVQELKAATDRERRNVALEGAPEKSHLAGVAMRLCRVGPRVPLRAVRLRGDVDAAREDDAVEDIERLVHPVDGRRYDERAAPGPLDRLDVVVGDEGRRELPRAPPRGLRVRGDADDRPAAHAGNVAQSCPDDARVESTQAASAEGGVVSPARAPR